MMSGQGQFGPIDIGGMFTILKIRAEISNYDDPSPYQNPPGTVATSVPGTDSEKEKANETMHHDHS